MNTQPQTHTNPVHMHIVGKTAFTDKQFIPLEAYGAILSGQKLDAKHRIATNNNFKRFAYQYKIEIPKKNKEVKLYNDNVENFIKENNLTERSKIANQEHKKEFYRTSINEYNEAAKIKNAQFGELILKLKTHKPIQPSSYRTFEQLLVAYSIQIEQLNKTFKHSAHELRRVQVNLYEMVNNCTEDGIPYHDCDTRTIQNHLFRFIEAGILFGYEFKGYHHNKVTGKRSGKPSEYFINGDILTIFNPKIKKSLNTQNQLFRYREKKKLTNTNTVTRTNRNKKEIIGLVNKQSRIKGTETLAGVLDVFQSLKSDNQNIYENTNQRKQLSQEHDTPGREKLKETSIKMEQFLTDAIEDRQLLLEKYSKGEFKKWYLRENASKTNPYAMVTLQHLEYEEEKGIMFTDDYLELLHQILFKTTGNIYRKTNKKGLFNYVGQSYKGYMALKTMLLNNNGTMPSKKVALTRFKGLLWRVKFASNFFNSTNVDPLFINEYLDTTRTTSKEIGFSYTLNFYIEHQKLENFNKKVTSDKENQKKKAEVRKRNLKAIELVEKQVNKLKNGKITIPQLHDYVYNNAHIPNELRQKLPHYIERIYKC